MFTEREVCLGCVRTNLPRHCLAGMPALHALSEPTAQALCGRDVGCLTGVRTYLLGTVGQGCRLFKRCQNLTPEHCGAGVRVVKAVSEPTTWAR